jgi:hypothetical protein
VAWDVLAKQLSIHGAFLLGAIVLAVIDYLHVKAEVLHHEEWDKGKGELEVCEPKMEKKILTEHKH